MSRSNTAELVGSTAFVEQDYPLLHLPDLIWELEPIPDCDSQWLAYYLQTKRSRLELRVRAAGTSGSMKKLSRRSLRSLQICLPPHDQQRRSASLIASLAKATTNTACLVAAKQRLKRGLTEQLLSGKRRFKGFDGRPWREARLGDHSHEPSLRNIDGLTVASVMAVRKDRGIVPMKEGLASADLGRYMTVRPGWFAYNPMRLNIGSIAQWTGSKPILVSPDYVVFKSDEAHLRSSFLRHFINSHRWRGYVSASGNGGVRVRSYFQDLARMPLVLPSIEEQSVIAGILDALDREIDLLIRLHDAYGRQRRGIAEVLLTGTVRVPA